MSYNTKKKQKLNVRTQNNQKYSIIWFTFSLKNKVKTNLSFSKKKSKTLKLGDPEFLEILKPAWVILSSMRLWKSWYKIKTILQKFTSVLIFSCWYNVFYMCGIMLRWYNLKKQSVIKIKIPRIGYYKRVNQVLKKNVLIFKLW